MRKTSVLEESWLFPRTKQEEQLKERQKKVKSAKKCLQLKATFLSASYLLLKCSHFTPGLKSIQLFLQDQEDSSIHIPWACF